MSEAPEFTIESVKIRPIDKSLFPPGEAPPFDYRMVLFARMNDGRSFANEQWVTQEVLDDVGEAMLMQGMRDTAYPPETPS